MSRLVAAPPPNRVRSPTDRHFASSCSPRRFGPTQLPLATELWHTPARTFTVLMWRPHGRTHSRMFLAGIQKMCGLDLRWETDEVTVGTNVSYGTTGTFGTSGTRPHQRPGILISSPV